VIHDLWRRRGAVEGFTPIENPSDKPPADAGQATLVAAGATTSADWPRDGYHDGPMTIGADPGQCKDRTAGDHDFEIRVCRANGNAFVVP